MYFFYIIYDFYIEKNFLHVRLLKHTAGINSENALHEKSAYVLFMSLHNFLLNSGNTVRELNLILMVTFIALSANSKAYCNNLVS